MLFQKDLKSLLKIKIALLNGILWISCSVESKQQVFASSFSQSVSGSNGHGCPVPNRFSNIQNMANQNTNALASASALNNERATGGPLSHSLHDSRWQFMDQVIAQLRLNDSRWGYTCIRGNCDDISTDAIAYWCGSGSPGESTNVGTVDIITGAGRVAWQDHTPETMANQNATAMWIYPRPGKSFTNTEDSSDNNVSDFAWSKVTFLKGTNISRWSETSPIRSVEVSNNGICIDHPKNGQWTGKVAIPPASGESPLRLEANHWIVVKKGGKYYAGTYEWIRNGGQRCKLGGGLRKIYHELGADQINVHPLNKKWVPKGGDVVGFMASGLARNNVRNERERTNIQWYRLPSIDGSIQGQMLGSFSQGSNQGSSKYNCCPPPNRFDIVQRVASETGDLYKTDVQQFTQKVAECLKDVDRHWGRRLNDSGVLGKDTVAYYVQGSDIPYSIDIVRGAATDNPVLHWNIQEHNGVRGQVGGTWVEVTGQCILNDSSTQITIGKCSRTPNTCEAGIFHPHPEDSDTHYLWTCRNIPHSSGETPCDEPKSSPVCPPDKKEPHYKAVGNACLPSCGAAKGTSVLRECLDFRNYNIQWMPVHDVNLCCKRHSKTACPGPHYQQRSYRGRTNCFPSCGAAAYFAGYGHYGPDKIEGTEDDPHVFANIRSCRELNAFGNDDWKGFTFYDPYRFKNSNNREVFETIGRSNVRCCARGEKGPVPVHPPNSQREQTEEDPPDNEECLDGVIDSNGNFCEGFSP